MKALVNSREKDAILHDRTEHNKAYNVSTSYPLCLSARTYHKAKKQYSTERKSKKRTAQHKAEQNVTRHHRPLY